MFGKNYSFTHKVRNKYMTFFIYTYLFFIYFTYLFIFIYEFHDFSVNLAPEDFKIYEIFNRLHGENAIVQRNLLLYN